MGYQLVQIEDSAENAFVEALLGFGGRTDQAWIGLENVGAGYVWPDGAAVTFTAWDIGEPNGTGPCVRMRDTGRWADMLCGNNFAYVCEAP